jgi:hypothetical protein
MLSPNGDRRAVQHPRGGLCSVAERKRSARSGFDWPASVCLLIAARKQRIGVNASRSRHTRSRIGLAHKRVKRIVQDSRGFLWFCTGGGFKSLSDELSAS